MRAISVDGATLWHADGAAIDVVAELLPAAGRIDDTTRLEVDHRWSVACARNPRLFDGPILSVAGFDPRAGRLSLERRTYRDYATQGELELGVTLLAVNGLVLSGPAEAPLDQQHILVGERSQQVHVHPGRLEPAPAGGVDPLGTGRAPTMDDFRSQLAAEAREEIGPWPELEQAIGRATPVGLAFDHQARSCDVVLSVRLDAESPLPNGWEYEAIEWMPLDRFVKLADLRPAAIIPPAVALAGLLRSRCEPERGRGDAGEADQSRRSREADGPDRGPDPGRLRFRGAS